MLEEMSVLAIEVSETQRETIRQLFAHNDWEFNEVPIEENRSNSQALQDTDESDPHLEEYVINQDQWLKNVNIVCVVPVSLSRPTDTFGG